MRRLVLIASFLCASGCYHYLPVEPPAAPTVGQRVRLALTPEGTSELARFLGPRVTEAEGALVSMGVDRSLVVAVDFVAVAGIRQAWSGEGSVTFPPSYIAGTRERRFERRRSIVASAAGVGGLILIAVMAFQIAGGGGGPGDGGTPPPP